MKKIVITLAISVFCLCSCVFDRVETIAIKNLSDLDIAVCYSCADVIINNQETNDSLWKTYYKIERNYNVERIPYPPFFNYGVVYKDSIKGIEFLYKNQISEVCKDSTIKFFFIDYSIFRNNSIDTIAKYQLYEKMVFSNDDLVKMNWVIEYK